MSEIPKLGDMLDRVCDGIRYLLKPARHIPPDRLGKMAKGDFPEPPNWITRCGISSVEWEKYFNGGPSDFREYDSDDTWLEWRSKDGDDPIRHLIMPIVWYTLWYADSPEWKRAVEQQRWHEAHPIKEYTAEEVARIDEWHSLREKAGESKDPCDAAAAIAFATLLMEDSKGEFLEDAMRAEIRQFQKRMLDSPPSVP